MSTETDVFGCLKKWYARFLW